MSAPPNKRFCKDVNSSNPVQVAQQQAMRQAEQAHNTAQLHKLEAAYRIGNRWDQNSELIITFMEGTPKQKETVQRVIKETFDDLINLKLTFKQTHDPKEHSDIRITFNPNIGSWSYVGNDNKNIPQTEPTMNFAWLDEPPEHNYGVIKHELGHALGLIHVSIKSNFHSVQSDKNFFFVP